MALLLRCKVMLRESEFAGNGPPREEDEMHVQTRKWPWRAQGGQQRRAQPSRYCRHPPGKHE